MRSLNYIHILRSPTKRLTVSSHCKPNIGLQVYHHVQWENRLLHCFFYLNTYSNLSLRYSSNFWTFSLKIFSFFLKTSPQLIYLILIKCSSVRSVTRNDFSEKQLSIFFLHTFTHERYRSMDYPAIPPFKKSSNTVLVIHNR